MRRAIIAATLVGVSVAAPAAAHAFCGFYVEGSGDQLTNDATQVVLMREGTRTVLSMQNHYQGPPEAFAMVVPVPVVLGETDVKILPHDVLHKLEGMDAPRLVEYWEQDPCDKPVDRRSESSGPRPPPKAKAEKSAGGRADLGVTIETQFAVGEYQIVILSATDSTGLETWLAQEKYTIPAGAEPRLRPYVEGGWKFFVAKVDPAKVTFKDGKAVLSPLRFHYDSEEFVLPIRLGLINSSGKQDLIVHLLARGKRYEVANYPNVFIPTNLDVRDAAKDKFGEFYAALFDRTIEKNPGAVVTEYAWDAGTCDPCPGPTLTGSDLATLGADVIDGGAKPAASAGAPAAKPAPPPDGGRVRRPPGRPRGSGFVLTRLHARYGTDLQDDLVFREASAVVGGRERRDASGALETGAVASSVNNFQGRYAVRHEWTGPIACASPVRGRWGGPPEGEKYAGAQAGRDLAFAPRGQLQLAQMVVGDVPEIEVKAAGAGPAPTPSTEPSTSTSTTTSTTTTPEKAKTGCGCQAGGEPAGVALLLLGLLLIRKRRIR